MAAPGAGVTVVVPVRGLPAGKSRLAAVLQPAQRNQLVRAMLGDVVRVLRSAPAVARVIVLSRDAAAAQEAERLEVDFLQEPPGAPGLNRALAFAQTRLAESDALLLVPADLPLITRTDVEQLVAASPAPPGVVVAPSRDGGTNGLLLRPPAVITPAFGAESAARHIAAAEEAGAAVVRVEDVRWALDIDSPEDLALAASLDVGQEKETVWYLRSPELTAAIRSGSGGSKLPPPPRV